MVMVTSDRLHLLSIKWIGSVLTLNTTFMFGRKEGTCECNQTYGGYLRTGSGGIIFITGPCTMINEVQRNKMLSH